MSRPRSIAGLLAAAVFALAAGAEGATVAPHRSPARTAACTLAASVSGHDEAPGSVRRPFRTVRRLLAALRPGQVGCLLGGTFVENVSIERPGTAAQRIVLRSAPGTRARIEGYLVIRDSANFVTVRNLDVDGHGVGPITVHVYGDHALLDGLDVTNRNKLNVTNTGSCILLGRVGLPVHHAVVQRSRIHHCGSSGHDHGIYAEFPRDAVIRDNYIYASPGYGISMYPDAQRTLITRNVIDGNGHGNITFSGEAAGKEYAQDFASSGNRVTLNVITNARSRYNIESFFPSLRPSGNSVSFNCVWNAPWGNFGYTAGYSRSNNIEADPQYRDPARGDFRLRPGSPCRGKGPRARP
jgi:hypothetical protein